MSKKLGLSGRIAKTFLLSEITPLLALVGILLGVFAVMVTPREEEPQINVTFANVFIAFPGASAQEVEQLVSTPAEQVLSEISGVEHVYSVSLLGQSVLTVQFEVGEDRTQAIVRLYNAIYSNQDWLPKGLGVGQPIIKPKGIDDVPIVTLTLWGEAFDSGSYSGSYSGTYELQQVAHAIEAELKRVPGTRNIYTVGGVERVVSVRPDAARLSGYGIALDDLRRAIQGANHSQHAGQLVTGNTEIQVHAGQFLANADEVAALVVGVNEGRPIRLSDVAEVRLGAEHPEIYSWLGTAQGDSPAVTIAIAKKPGINAVEVANKVIHRFEQLKGIVVPDGIHATVTRNYGATANDKAQKLIGKLAFATGFVVLLVLFAVGLREAFIVGTAVVITLAATLFASWAWGFTINRVSLFALIFSIGILVDDAIVVVENIHRHMKISRKSLREIIPIAVDEVGGPTILATFAVIAALLPMAFVSGLMGPYMSPIPINASMGMMISLAVAFVVTPWMTYKLLHRKHARASKADHQETEDNNKLFDFFQRYMGPMLRGNKGKSRRWLLLAGILLLIGISVALPVFKLVVLKMLPFDNKSEFQVVVDMPEGSSIEQTAQLLRELGNHLVTVPEVENYQAYAGTAAPINFNGLVRQYYLRRGANVGDLQVNLSPKNERDRKSHDIAASVRGPLVEIGHAFNASVKIVEVPPGPPVQAPLVAEIYGIDYAGQRAIAKQVRSVFESTADVVDVDDSVEAQAPRLRINIDRAKAALWGVSQQQIVAAISTVLGGENVSYLHGAQVKYPVPIRLVFPVATKADIDSVLALKLRVDSANRSGNMPGNNQSGLVSMSELVTVQHRYRDQAIYHKDLLPVVFVTGDLAGKLDSPLYGMFDIAAALSSAAAPAGQTNTTGKPASLEQYFFSQPEDTYQYSLKWDGEWQITFETFRDMGIAYAVGIILIYLLVVAQFRSYGVPLIIMAPIPLTIIGVMPGHVLMGEQYTATSMIGMIALAGIIVRNSILLVDFVQQQVAAGVALEEAVLRAGAVRAKPIVLTGLAAMLGALFIIDDPIFSGLAISLIFGILVSTVLTLVVIPVMYYAFQYQKQNQKQNQQYPKNP
ncbi:MAG: efflux RND transporter permease subunit [Ectothiorhodospiraceae bacterium]|nr:efflux RND transporter permease subunit [Ectothiorhodospiraceae bacterium]